MVGKEPAPALIRGGSTLARFARQGLNDLAADGLEDIEPLRFTRP